MPMPGNYNWRPNDNGALTNLRYDIEASKWVNSVRRAQSNLPKGDFASDLGFIGAIFTLPLCLLLLVLLIPIQIIKVVFKYNIRIFPGDEPTGPILSDREKFRARMDYLDKKYPPKKKRKTTWEDLTDEQQELVKAVRAETARAKAKAKL